MSAAGHTRSFGDVGSMSGLPPIADIARQFLEQVGGRPVAPSAWPHRTNLWRHRTNPRRGSERLRGIGPMMWESENALSSNISPTCRAKRPMFDPLCQLRPRLARPPAPTAGAFFFGEIVASADSLLRPHLRRRSTTARRWQRRTNVWRKATSPAPGAQRLRSVAARAPISMRSPHQSLGG